MKLNTASAIISFCRQLEEDGAQFYENLAQKYSQDGETLLSFAKENRRNIVDIERSYYGVISDALEGCFSFDMDVDNSTFKTELTGGTNYSDILGTAIEIEDRTIEFYLEAAEQSKALMADVPRVFQRVAKKRTERKAKLQSLMASK
jgi:rubrerythrin